MQSEDEIRQRSDALSQAVQFCKGQSDPQEVVKAFSAFYSVLTGEPDEVPLEFNDGKLLQWHGRFYALSDKATEDDPKLVAQASGGYVLRWRDIDYVPAPTTTPE